VCVCVCVLLLLFVVVFLLLCSTQKKPTPNNTTIYIIYSSYIIIVIRPESRTVEIMSRLLLILSLAILQISYGRLMLWMCLEFCDQGDTAANQLAEISRHLNVVSAVSFEKYTLGANCTLLDNELTEVGMIAYSFA
jgi:hypothetical protein